MRSHLISAHPSACASTNHLHELELLGRCRQILRHDVPHAALLFLLLLDKSKRSDQITYDDAHATLLTLPTPFPGLPPSQPPHPAPPTTLLHNLIPPSHHAMGQLPLQLIQSQTVVARLMSQLPLPPHLDSSYSCHSTLRLDTTYYHHSTLHRRLLIPLLLALAPRASSGAAAVRNGARHKLDLVNELQAPPENFVSKLVKTLSRWLHQDGGWGWGGDSLWSLQEGPSAARG